MINNCNKNYAKFSSIIHDKYLDSILIKNRLMRCIIKLYCYIVNGIGFMVEFRAFAIAGSFLKKDCDDLMVGLYPFENLIIDD